MKVWIVEMWMDFRRTPKWESTCGAATTREYARAELARWRKNNPCDKFRLARYVRKDQK